MRCPSPVYGNSFPTRATRRPAHRNPTATTASADQQPRRHLTARGGAAQIRQTCVCCLSGAQGGHRTQHLDLEKVSPGLKNVRIPFALSQARLTPDSTDGFVVSPGVEKEFFTLYEKARYANVPIFVTSDSLLHVYHLLFDKVLRTAEVQLLHPAAARPERGAAGRRPRRNTRRCKAPRWEDAARRTVAFVGVASTAAGSRRPSVPAYAPDLVEAELALIEAAAGIQPSPIFPGLEFGEDYTQYIPRGHYTRART